MTAKATRTRQAPAKGRKSSNSPIPSGTSPKAEFSRWTPEQVSENGWLPYTPRVIREKCYKRQLFCHRDGGRITFNAEDLRRNSELGAQAPAA